MFDQHLTLDFSTMSAEEINWMGGHFDHIVQRNIKLREERSYQLWQSMLRNRR